ncbi:MAG TPA: hypothetical protein ENG10_04875 [Candidatus Bathyarchaeota archaeon]|nr:hypothetical protein [Candidatus Bathyarchaeota archaeon]HEX69609.1 hypothetical protein [Candidatus Bathyarchaeota archaeon]
MSDNKELLPKVGTKILFKAATAFARKITFKGLVILSGSHRGQMATLDNGYIIIDRLGRQWFPK